MTMLEAIRDALDVAMHDPDVMLLGQLVKYGLGGMTTGLAKDYPSQVITFPVCEGLMNGSAFGLALAGKRPVVIHERMDFLAVGMDPLVNHIPVWPARAKMALPLVIIVVIGKGKGQGPQHSKNLTPWFRMMDGWTVVEPDSPQAAHHSLVAAIRGDKPVLYVVHREFFGARAVVKLPRPDRVGLCGASQHHERAFYGDGS